MRCAFMGYGVWGMGYGENSYISAYGYTDFQALNKPHTPNPIPHTPESISAFRKRGFGLLEVLAAAVVFAFLFIGLNILQKGNREGVLRVRARDAASMVAQEVIDSISAIGSASVTTGSASKHRIFEGVRAINSRVDYEVSVAVREEIEQKTEHETEYSLSNALDINHQFAKQVDVTVSWKFKNSNQSINVSAVIR